MRILPLSFETAEENLAFEEWFFHYFKEDTIRIWRNPTSVVVGKHQNALAEVNLAYCLENNIPVIRRISGGGTVYHDLGNINFSFFRNVEKEKMIDYVKNLDLIKEVLTALGFPVHMSERHDLFLREFKVSGNAQHVRKGKALHHGTLLYDANLGALSAGIKRTSGEFVDKSVKSVRSPIFNLKEEKNLGSTEAFEAALCKKIQEKGYEASLPPKIDVEAIFELVRNKYTQESWNFGYSPKYIFTHETEFGKAELNVDRGGVITDAEVQIRGEIDRELSDFLIGKRHFYQELETLLTSSPFSGANDPILKLIF